VAKMASFVREGCEKGDPVLSVTSRAKNEALREALGDLAAGVDFRDAVGWYRHPYETLAAYDRYVAEHANGHIVRVIGEPVWSDRSPAAVREWARYESVLNHAFAESPVWIVCPYDASTLPDEVVEQASHTHPEVVRPQRTDASPHFEPPQRFVEHVMTDDPAAPPPEARALSFDGSDYGAVRDFVLVNGARAGLQMERLEELTLAVTELVTNAALHGRPPVIVRIWPDNAAVVCEVEDAGGGFHDALTGYTEPPPASPSGRGLWIVRRVCDCVDVLRGEGRFAVRVHMSFEPAAAV
jgi:anti-sigma regulatory factor (Ser/Thr protein kinase)